MLPFHEAGNVNADGSLLLKKPPDGSLVAARNGSQRARANLVLTGIDQNCEWCELSGCATISGQRMRVLLQYLPLRMLLTWMLTIARAERE